MNKKIKLLVLLILSTSVFFIYQITKDSKTTITIIGDRYSLGINSYGIKEISYIDYVKQEFEKEKRYVELYKYQDKNETINNVLNEIKNTNKIKRVLRNTDYLIIHLGINDLITNISLEDNLTNSSLNEIIKKLDKNIEEFLAEIKKYYHNEIIVLGYSSYNSNDYYKIKGINKLNEKLKKQKNSTYIDLDEILNPKEKYYLNPNSTYPNSLGYIVIGKKIIRKTLEI